MSTPPSRPHHLPKAPPPNTITLGGSVLSTYEFGGGYNHSDPGISSSASSQNLSPAPPPHSSDSHFHAPPAVQSHDLNPGCCHYLKLFHLWQCITVALLFQNIHSFSLLTKITSDIAAPGSQAFTRGLNPNTGFPASPACRRQITGLLGPCNHGSQFLLIDLICIHLFCFSGDANARTKRKWEIHRKKEMK